LSRLRKLWSKTIADKGPAAEPEACASFLDRPPDPEWAEHVETVPGILLDVLRLERGLQGKRVLEIGCGPGLTALGLAQQGTPDLLVAFDLGFHMKATLEGFGTAPYPERRPSCLRYLLADAACLGLKTSSFDLAYAWSVFEHLPQPQPVLAEIRRVLKPGGLLYIQIAPLYYSAFGHHCWEHVSDPFAHLKWTQERFRTQVMASRSSPERVRRDWQTYEGLNRLTVGGLQKLLLDQGWALRRSILQCDDLKEVDLEGPLARIPLQDLAAVQINLVAKKSAFPSSPCKA